MSQSPNSGGRRRIRSMLFVPGNRPDWVARAPSRYGPDAVMVDWEDAVPLTEKAAARRALVEVVDTVASSSSALYVRLNGWGTGQLIADLDAVVLAGVDGVALAKTASPDDIRALDLALTELELARRLPTGMIEILPMPETAYAMLHRYDCLAASARCRRATGVAGSAPGGDYYRATGYEWRRDGLESLANNADSALAARAAGIENVLCGPVTQIEDLDYVREVLTRARQLGANGALLIHPSHISVAHDVFSPSAEQIAEAVAVMRAMAESVNDGRAAVRLHGMMVDYAHVRTSLDLLELAAEAGLEVPDYPVIDVASR